jgi:DNA-binding MarR family transcriptional regulator
MLSESGKGLKQGKINQFDRLIHAPARLLIMKTLYVLEGGDMVFLKNQTGLTWGNLSVQVRKLEEAGYIRVDKEFVENKPHTVLSMTETGRSAFEAYRENIQDFLK